MNVQLVSKTTGVGKYKELNSEEIISAIARHGVIKEDNGKLVKYLMTHHHWSPLDMINFTFEVETSRAIGRQILRHSSIKFQEHSQRYSDEVEFEEIELRKEHPTNRQSSTEVFDPMMFYYEGQMNTNHHNRANTIIERLLTDIQIVYNELLRNGVAKECARMILPECTRSTLSANGTLRSWLSFLNVRVESNTQKECKQIAFLIGEELEKELPNVFSIINWRDGLFM